MQPKKVFLVEDNADDEQLTLRAMRLSEVPNIVQVARDGAEAIEALPTTDEHSPDLILLDLKLPKVSGLDVLSKIRANTATKSVPVIVLTSSDEERDISESYNRGANSFVKKPVDFEEFIDAVRQVGMYWLGMNKSDKS